MRPEPTDPHAAALALEEDALQRALNRLKSSVERRSPISVLRGDLEDIHRALAAFERARGRCLAEKVLRLAR